MRVKSHCDILLLRPLLLVLMVGRLSVAQESSPALSGNNSPVAINLARVSPTTIEIRLGSKSARQMSPDLLEVSREKEWSANNLHEEMERVSLGELQVEITRNPLKLSFKRADGTRVQELVFPKWPKEASLEFCAQGPLLGLGQCAAPLDRRGASYPMVPKYGVGSAGSTVPSPLLISSEGWALFIPWPTGEFNLTQETCRFIPGKEARSELHCFLIAWKAPVDIYTEYVRLCGRPVLPPKWALGYMQSHRTLSSPEEILEVAKTFREKELPCDALIYLGTGYCPSGWNLGHGSVEFNPNVFPQPQEQFRQFHDLDFRVVLHWTYPDNSLMRGLHGDFTSPNCGDPLNICNYWENHRPVFSKGVDGWWIDDGDPLSTSARLARHRCYFQGPLSDRPNRRPWSLHRTGAPGMSRYGGWLWSGDIDGNWKTLAAQVTVGIGTSLSLTPFWGTDTRGFFLTPETTGELYVRWFQFSAFCPSFRSHGFTWNLCLPWGWNKGNPGIVESKISPDPKELRNPDVERICRQVLNLRYQLLPYNYSLAREVHETGMPMMRALWMHYPREAEAVKRGDEYLWGRDLLVAPVLDKGATEREVYLPQGEWYDWWSWRKFKGGKQLKQRVSLEQFPLYVRAGAVIPLDPVRQFTAQIVKDPTTLLVYTGADGEFNLYDDDGNTMEYLKGSCVKTRVAWDDTSRRLAIDLVAGNQVASRSFKVRLIPGNVEKLVRFEGKKISLQF